MQRIQRQILKAYYSLLLFALQSRSTFNKHYTVELQWLKHLWNHENMFETGEVLIIAPDQEAY